MTLRNTALTALLLGLFSFSASGCAVHATARPAPVASSSRVWVSGYWVGKGPSRRWVQGHWQQSNKRHWVAGRWAGKGARRRWVAGHWA